ncbi:uncharacterized protein LY79DRAFT_156023 [Colletotrichum navitas]|uniref:Uncharacterized protein n=1 Tax=Colletotrichum navitas TaxID=681940 RepID=A0AAD8Q2B5_9PEZI|nr:uncharacterized protein LY79DRAFT_156023 [Colletotrichum navitas]KAK1594413.1 hypothetical protein LY79DRAFT_156023 [Colletotrichum navitas]
MNVSTSNWSCTLRHSDQGQDQIRVGPYCIDWVRTLSSDTDRQTLSDELAYVNFAYRIRRSRSISSNSLFRCKVYKYGNENDTLWEIRFSCFIVLPKITNAATKNFSNFTESSSPCLALPFPPFFPPDPQLLSSTSDDVLTRCGEVNQQTRPTPNRPLFSA